MPWEARHSVCGLRSTQFMKLIRNVLTENRRNEANIKEIILKWKINLNKDNIFQLYLSCNLNITCYAHMTLGFKTEHRCIKKKQVEPRQNLHWGA